MAVTRQSVRALSAALGLALLAGFGLTAAPAVAADGPVGSVSGLPIPRFVSLKSDRVNVRGGPNKDQEVRWVYTRAGMPVEITAEFENWRRIRDADGTEGWVYHSLLSGKRTAMVTAKTADALVPVYESPDLKSGVVARLERGVVGVVKRCDDGWCSFHGKGFEGFIQETRLWGVYPNEKVD